MSFLRDWEDRIPIGGGLYSLLALVVLFVIAIGYLLFINSSIISPLRTRNELASQLVSAEGDLLVAQRAEKEKPDRLREQVATAQAGLEDAASTFLGESQAAAILNRLYQYASESGVEITDLQTQVGPEQEEKGLYDARTFQLEVQGAFPRLANFVSRIREAAVTSMIITNVNIAEGTERHVLTMAVTLYTSPYTSESTGSESPDVTPLAPPPDLAQLDEALAAAWAAEEWEQAIGLTSQILTIDPGYDDMLEKLYVAYVNYGLQLLDEGNPGGAITQFNAAVEIKPGGEEALAGLELAVATPVPTLTVEEQLAQGLDEPWKEENWEEVIAIIEQILDINPDFDDMTEKLYAAHVNHGYQLASENKLEEAKEAFIRALDIKPEGEEATAGLRALAEGTIPATPAPQPEYIIYVVQRGDTLYSIARRYGTTVQAIMAANNLPNYNIRVGQELRIPVRQ